MGTANCSSSSSPGLRSDPPLLLEVLADHIPIPMPCRREARKDMVSSLVYFCCCCNKIFAGRSVIYMYIKKTKTGLILHTVLGVLTG